VAAEHAVHAVDQAQRQRARIATSLMFRQAEKIADCVRVGPEVARADASGFVELGAGGEVVHDVADDCLAFHCLSRAATFMPGAGLAKTLARAFRAESRPGTTRRVRTPASSRTQPHDYRDRQEYEQHEVEYAGNALEQVLDPGPQTTPASGCAHCRPADSSS
jgi:hypothetical protein